MATPTSLGAAKHPFWGLVTEGNSDSIASISSWFADSVLLSQLQGQQEAF